MRYIEARRPEQNEHREEHKEEHINLDRDERKERQPVNINAILHPKRRNR